MANCLRSFSHKILPINGIATTKNHSNRLTRKIPMRTQFLEDVSLTNLLRMYCHILADTKEKWMPNVINLLHNRRKIVSLGYMLCRFLILDIELIIVAVKIFNTAFTCFQYIARISLENVITTWSIEKLKGYCTDCVCQYKFLQTISLMLFNMFFFFSFYTSVEFQVAKPPQSVC